jgi:hypothetical protein
VDTHITFTFLESNGMQAKQKNVQMDARWMRDLPLRARKVAFFP